MSTTHHTQVVIKFAGDSGDGMQLTGHRFTAGAAEAGNDLSTYPDFPAEIRAPQGTLSGVSGFQIHFGSRQVYTPGDAVDVLVAMNAAALKTNLSGLRKTALIIANESGFDSKNLRLAGYASSPLDDGSLSDYRVVVVDVTLVVREALKESALSQRDKDRCRNMFVLGLLSWMYGHPLTGIEAFLEKKFKKNAEVLEANLTVLRKGRDYGETSELFANPTPVPAATMAPGNYRSITGNEAAALGLIAGAEKAGLPLFLGSYPITPASDILHFLARHKNRGVRTFQAEDEIASICAALGASFGGSLGVTTTSGPGMALKAEAIGLAVSLELPLVICNIQRAGPSTGMPTKTEQADLFQALYGRNGESPVPVIAAETPSDCFAAAFEACRIAVEHMTPVIFLSDAYLANGSEPWRYPKAADLAEIRPRRAATDQKYQPYARNEDLVRAWATPGTKDLQFRIGGLEKEDVTGNVSYDPENHEMMVAIREERVARIAGKLPPLVQGAGPDRGHLLILGWGSTFGAIRAAVRDLHQDGHKQVTHLHLRHLNPLPSDLRDWLRHFDQILLPEMNRGQLVQLLRAKYLVNVRGLSKVQGRPFTRNEIYDKALAMLTAAGQADG